MFVYEKTFRSIVQKKHFNIFRSIVRKKHFNIFRSIVRKKHFNTFRSVIQKKHFNILLIQKKLIIFFNLVISKNFAFFNSIVQNNLFNFRLKFVVFVVEKKTFQITLFMLFKKNINRNLNIVILHLVVRLSKNELVKFCAFLYILTLLS